MENVPYPANGNQAQESKEKKRVLKIHFLVHPGYRLQTQVLFSEPESDEMNEKYRELLQHYKRQATELPDDEIMIVFSYEPRASLRNVAKGNEDYFEVIRDIKEILGSRCILISADQVPPDARGEFRITDSGIENLKKIISARGFDFDRNILTEAYGEMFASCVHSVANSVNKKAGFIHPTEINTHLTDAGASVDSVSQKFLDPEYIKKLNKKYKHTNTEALPKNE